MDIDLLTIASRANLSAKIKMSFDNGLERLIEIEGITTKINQISDFSDKEKLQSNESGIIAIISVMEQLLNEVLYQVLVSNPKKFGEKKFDIDELIEEGSILELFNRKANQKILDLAYGRFDRFIRNFRETLELTSEIDSEATQDVNEIKCTRDCIIHSAGVATPLYFTKVGSKERARRIGEKLKIDYDYFKKSTSTVKRFLHGIQSSLPEKLANANRAFIFKQMWEATCLNHRVKFDRAWTIENASMARPVDIENEYGFSSSELEVYNLFRHIYNSHTKVDFTHYFLRWKPQSREYQIAASWLDSQFYF